MMKIPDPPKGEAEYDFCQVNGVRISARRRKDTYDLYRREGDVEQLLLQGDWSDVWKCGYSLAQIEAQAPAICEVSDLFSAALRRRARRGKRMRDEAAGATD